MFASMALCSFFTDIGLQPVGPLRLCVRLLSEPYAPLRDLILCDYEPQPQIGADFFNISSLS